jgi:hypothetical protein
MWVWLGVLRTDIVAEHLAVTLLAFAAAVFRARQSHGQARGASPVPHRAMSREPRDAINLSQCF